MNTEKMTQRIECKPTEDGTVAIAFIETNNTGRFVKLPAQEAVNLATTILEAARLSTQTPNRLTQQSTSLAGVAGLKPTKVGLAPGVSPDEVTLVVHFGQARIGFRLPLREILSIGQANFFNHCALSCDGLR